MTLETLVPANHFVRQLEAKLDLEFVRELVEDRYRSSDSKWPISHAKMFPRTAQPVEIVVTQYYRIYLP